MSQNSKLSCSNVILPAGLKAKRAREHFHGQRWSNLLYLLPFGVILIVGLWYILSLCDGNSAREVEIPDTCKEKAWNLLKHYNVSESQFHALASFFFHSDQAASLQCAEDPGPGIGLKECIACALKMLEEELNLQKQRGWLSENLQPEGQCPIRGEMDSFNNDLLQLVDKTRSLTSQSSFAFVSPCHQIHREKILHSKEIGNEPSRSLNGLVMACLWILAVVISCLKMSSFHLKLRNHKHKPIKHPSVEKQPMIQLQQVLLQKKQLDLSPSPPKGAGKWRKKLLIIFVLLGVIGSFWLFWYLNNKIILRREETLANMCDERARMLQDQFNVSMNHVHALAILVSTFHHGKHPSAIDQKTFSEYAERTSFERPLTSGVAYALKVNHSERNQFEEEHGWTIKKMGTEDQTLVQDCIPENLDPAPFQDEYAPVIFSQETVSHIVSIDMMSGKEDRENILRARASGKGVLTSPFKLLKSNHLGVVLTFAVYNTDLPPDATPEQRTEATVGYLGASYDVPSLVDKLLHQLSSKQSIVVDVYDTTNASGPIKMYGSDVVDTGLLHISNLDFGDPQRKHEMHCRFKQMPQLPWMAINASVGVLVITLLVGHIFYAAISRIAKVENDVREMMKLKTRAEAADVAKSQFLATVSHEIRTPMNGVLGMLKMLMDTDLDPNQQDYAQTAYDSGKELISLINEVLDQAKIESGRLELEDVPFDPRALLDNVLSMFSGKCHEKGIELAVYVSNLVPEVLIGDPGRFRQIITNLVGNSIKFTNDKGHIFVTVHLADELKTPLDAMDSVLRQGLDLVKDTSKKSHNTLSGFPVVERCKSWEHFEIFSRTDAMKEDDLIKLLVSVEDTGHGIPLEAQSRIFTPFMQADSSTSRKYGGTGIGLSISKCLVELMGGEIGFVSHPSVGSTFSFTGCLRKGDTRSLDTKWQQNDPTVLDFRGLQALVIDNRSIRAEVTKYHLKRLGISVDIVSSLVSAHEYVKNNCIKSPSKSLAMVLIDKDVWDNQTGPMIARVFEEHGVNGKEESTRSPKIFLLATSDLQETRALKSTGYISNVMTKPLRLGVLIGCFQEAFGKVNRKKPSILGNLLRDKQILVVDDNAVNRRVAEGALKKYGAKVTCVESGRAAISLLKPPHKFHACFMDLQMPEMDGFTATREIRNIEKKVNEDIASGKASSDMFGNVAVWHTPVLAMTADVIQATSEACMACGMDGYVAKPFEEEKLYSAVARFFESDGGTRI
ncbi:histidine kinase 2-like [Cucurbita pepo subsp. pepo]|uniref:histidine kinase 2-like n=1 Tax=Cucurbita pepo subsp. pepo TaxID=3664 RepID=UPI000C9D96BB|nr:histidine kinase 2-like [Cucurbita pepo subsp. pepo]XP_023529580.1 histidine kinase 2-like [Cucurbita pepo subsp. pepo]XP_023529581.1 histidine kinase 2-like [Cucurbita pepo subsp. pepo]XP_023529582.1 histidine kinase 2-like [Cucurbita pepo subsp. pepo]